MAYKALSNSNLYTDDQEFVHRQQNDELLFYSQVAGGDIEAIE